MEDEQSIADQYDRPSKSQLKRDMDALQQLGEQLTHLGADDLARMPISDSLSRALAEYKRVKGRGAMRRQLQYIGKVMRNEDGEAIAEALEQARAGSVEDKRRLHLTEQWRDRLLEQGDEALGDFLSGHPQADRQQLRQLIRGAAQEQARGKPPASARKLFRYLKETLFND